MLGDLAADSPSASSLPFSALAVSGASTLLLSASSLPKFGHDCRSIPHCDAIGKLRCATALQPVVAPPLEAFAATGSGGGATHSRSPIPLSLDSSNGRKMHEEGLCKHGHIDHKKSVLVEPKHGFASFPLHSRVTKTIIVW